MESASWEVFSLRELVRVGTASIGQVCCARVRLIVSECGCTAGEQALWRL